MRTTSLVTGYISTAFFLALGFRCANSWFQQRDKTSAHLAIATGLFGISQLISVISNSLYDSLKGQFAPTWVQILSSIVGLVAIYGFLIFLGDFVDFPRAVRALFALAALASVVFTIIERPDIKFDPLKGLVKIPGIHNPIDYKTYIGVLLIYYAIILAILWISFLVNALRVSGLARARMGLIASGFFLLFVVIGLLPRLIFGSVDPKTLNTVLQVAEYIAIVSAPLLFLGFSPPKWLANMFQPRSVTAS
ncbi:MAG TPA: hypothetical protein VKV69_09235 [Actinomycetota bacterium]|nr:hypothetical protein [Actinomycetota bacterium]